jgi:hypothetical protein
MMIILALKLNLTRYAKVYRYYIVRVIVLLYHEYYSQEIFSIFGSFSLFVQVVHSKSEYLSLVVLISFNKLEKLYNSEKPVRRSMGLH